MIVELHPGIPIHSLMLLKDVNKINTRCHIFLFVNDEKLHELKNLTQSKQL